MKKSLLAMLLAMVMLVGCGQAAEEADNKSENTGSDVVENTDVDIEDDSMDDFEEDYDSDYEQESEDATTEITLYNGQTATIYDENRTLISLGNPEQLIEKDIIEIQFPVGQILHFPAENVPTAIIDYTTVAATEDYEEEESYVYGDTLKSLRSWFKAEGQFVYFTMDNETAAEDVDLLTLPVTQIRISLKDGNVTVNGFEFIRNTFLITDLVAVWGDPVAIEVDDKSTREEDEDYDYEYYWRFNNGYIELSLEAGKLYELSIVKWDTYACEDDNLWGIPKYGEE